MGDFIFLFFNGCSVPSPPYYFLERVVERENNSSDTNITMNVKNVDTSNTRSTRKKELRIQLKISAKYVFYIWLYH
jgi:hypothetical protein